MEADLAFHARNPVDADLRNLYRRGSGLTLRRLNLLISALPPEALLWAELQAAKKKAEIPTVDQIRARQAHYDRQRAKVVADG